MKLNELDKKRLTELEYVDTAGEALKKAISYNKDRKNLYTVFFGNEKYVLVEAADRETVFRAGFKEVINMFDLAKFEKGGVK